MTENFINIFKKNYALLRLISSYACHSYDEIQEIAMFVYFTNPEIEEYLEKKEYKEANRLFRKKYRIEVRNDSYEYRNNEHLEQVYTMISTELNYKEFDLADFVERKEILEKVKELVGDDYDIMIDYYDFGVRYCSEKYGLKISTITSKMSRAMKQIRERVL